MPSGSRSGALVGGLVSALRAAEPELEFRSRWLRPEALRDWSAELIGPLRDRSRYLLLTYPRLPGLTGGLAIAPPALARAAYLTLFAKAWLVRQRIAVFVDELPVERAAGRAFADGRAPEFEGVERWREIERSVFRSAHRLLVPSGLADPITERYGLNPTRLRTFRRFPYPARVEPAASPPIEFESGTMNFFYSGSVDSHVAPNFREILRSIRNAPATRLHVCGQGRDAVREWLNELDVHNARHHGQLGLAEHDWLARRCDVGLILDPSDNPYAHLRPTLKYSAYLANGLAVLSTDLRSVAANIRRDRVGQAMPIRELALELLRWAVRPSLWASAKERAASLAPEIRSAAELTGWIAEITGGG